MIKFDLSSEIVKTQRLREKNVNYAGLISLLKLDESKFVLEEYLAKGKNMKLFNVDFYFNSKNYKDCELDFEIFFKPNLEEIKICSSVNQEVYDKLF